jgi:hypothetical protein
MPSQLEKSGLIYQFGPQVASDIGDVRRVYLIEGTSTTGPEPSYVTLSSYSPPSNCIVLATLDAVYRMTNANGRGAYTRKATIYRDAAGSATLQGTVTDVHKGESSGGGVDITLDVSSSNIIVKALTGEVSIAEFWWFLKLQILDSDA